MAQHRAADSHQQEDIVVEVVETVAEVRGCEPLDMPMMQDGIDGDALVRVVRSMPADASVEFSYAGYTVSVSGGGQVAVDGEVLRASDGGAAITSSSLAD